MPGERRQRGQDCRPATAPSCQRQERYSPAVRACSTGTAPVRYTSSVFALTSSPCAPCWAAATVPPPSSTYTISGGCAAPTTATLPLLSIRRQWPCASISVSSPSVRMSTAGRARVQGWQDSDAAAAAQRETVQAPLGMGQPKGAPPPARSETRHSLQHTYCTGGLAPSSFQRLPRTVGGGGVGGSAAAGGGRSRAPGPCLPLHGLAIPCMALLQEVGARWPPGRGLAAQAAWEAPCCCRAR